MSMLSWSRVSRDNNPRVAQGIFAMKTTTVSTASACGSDASPGGSVAGDGDGDGDAIEEDCESEFPTGNAEPLWA